MRRIVARLNRRASRLAVAAAFSALALVRATDAQAPGAGRVVDVTVHSPALEGNLSGESPDRNVKVYLPPSYDTDATRRYPAVYLLHGYVLSNSYWTGGAGGSIVDLAIVVGGGPTVDISAAVDRALERGAGREMIFVMPDARTRYFGSMYSTSVTIGDWERFIAEDLVRYVDRNYRTLARPESRGIAGHSMGGYGALRIGMKRPDAFSSLYSLSACCLMNDPVIFAESGGNRGNLFIATVSRAAAAAWSPNPDDAPEYFDRPGEDGVDEAMIAAKWAANSPLAMIDQYISNLRRYTAIALDVGSEDELRASNEQLAGVLEAYELDPEFEIYEGDHADRIAERIEERVIPFFAQQLVFE